MFGFFLVSVINRTFELLYLLIIARILMSWFRVPINRITKPIIDFIYVVTEPILGFFRGLLPMIQMGGMGLDISPILAILALSLLRTLIIGILSFVL